MKRVLLAAVVALFAMTSCSTYNGMVSKEEAVNRAWSNVETQYQRRADLIPNLVATVKGYAAHEEQTLTDVVEARSKATSVTLSAENLTPESLAEFQQAQSAVTSALGRLIAVSEGTENRITVARREFNEATQAYNVAVRKFPAVIIAKIFSFEQKPYFEADESAAEAPKVEF